MKTYLELLRHTMENGVDRDDRTGVGTRSVFGYQSRYDLQEGFPIITTKRIFWRGVVEEFLWMVVRGSTDVTEIEDRGINIWSPWKGEDGTIGPGYGAQFRSWPHVELGNRVGDGKGDVDVFHAQPMGIDQVENLIEGIKHNPESRRHLISLWNVGYLQKMELPPCHGIALQFYVRKGQFLDCQMYQRSGDIFLGVPWNISFYSLFTHVVAQLTSLEPGHFVHTLGDAHIYQNHFDQVKEQLSRDPKELPELQLNTDIKTIDDWTLDDIELVGYEHHPSIKAPIAV